MRIANFGRSLKQTIAAAVAIVTGSGRGGLTRSLGAHFGIRRIARLLLLWLLWLQRRRALRI